MTLPPGSHRFVSLDTYDVRFPTSRELDGSDAMNSAPDYSAAYVILGTNVGDGLEGHGFTFTIGAGNDVEAAAIGALRPYLVGRPVDALLDDLGGLWKELVHDSQLRWLGPEKGVMHMAIPTAPGFSATMHPQTLGQYTYPDGPIWTRPAAATDPTPGSPWAGRKISPTTRSGMTSGTEGDTLEESAAWR